MISTDCIVIGAGVIGLAIARQLSRRQEVLVFETDTQIGMGTSSRNSEVIHAGLYHPQNFLKHQLCQQGRTALYAYCQSNGINFSNCGKLLLACDDEEIPALKALKQQAICRGLAAQWLDTQALNQREADVNAVAALFIPESGIIDSHAYLHQLSEDIRDHGSSIHLQHEVLNVSQVDKGFVLTLRCQQQHFEVHCKTLINATGLNSDKVSKQLHAKQTTSYFCKGYYFQYSGPIKVNHLLYPLPNKQLSGLGIHLTLSLDGSIKFGPDAHYVNQDQLNYSMEGADKTGFLNAIQRYLPQITEDQLQPAYAGIRHKLSAEHEAAVDFCIQGPADHGVDQYIDCLGMESPGLTASLAIGNYVETLLWP